MSVLCTPVNMCGVVQESGAAAQQPLHLSPLRVTVGGASLFCFVAGAESVLLWCYLVSGFASLRIMKYEVCL